MKPLFYRALRLLVAGSLLSASPLFADSPRALAVDGPLIPAAPLSEADFASVNNSARGLAGLTPLSDHAPSPWLQTAEWKAYEDWMDGRWSYIQRVRLNAMRTWANADLSLLQGKSGTVYYPFSGPDFLYVNAFFPNSRFLLMAGLEPVGTMPNLAALQQQGRLPSYLQDVKTSLFTILAASFFKTKDMKSDFNNQLVDGLIPDIAVFLARDGYSIDSLQYVTLGHNGGISPHAASGADGVQITYFKGDRDDLHYLLYFRTDLGNDGLKSNPGYVNLMARLKPGVTYLKAASYLLYEDYFSTIRNSILDNSVGVVEDDSGIPLRHFKPALWDISVYGNYTGPIALFKEDYQADLAQFYATNPHPPLTFGSGYKFVAASSSMLVARKK